MKIIYLGAEVPSNRTLLESAGATEVGVSYWRLVKRGLPKTKAYLLSNYFPESMKIFVHAGIPRNQQLSLEELEQFAADYEEFVVNNIDRISLFSEVTHPGLSPEFIEVQRKTAWSQLPPAKFLPVWDPSSGKRGLNEMAQKYLDIAIPGESIEELTWLASDSRMIQRRHGTRFHAIGCAKPDNLRQIIFESASTLSWLSPMTHGETIVWDGTRLVRYPKRMKEQARSRYRQVYEKAWLDVDKILADDPQEVCRLAIWSYEQMETKINMMNHSGSDDELYTNSDNHDDDDNAETTLANVDKKGVGMRKVEPRNPDEMGPLPVFGYEYKSVVEQDEQGHDVIKEVPVVRSQSATLRQCDTCFVAANCPAFKPQSACAFNLPVEVKTKEQLKSLINAIIEMQGQRVAFMRFSEEMNGGYADPNVSQEIDRLFKLIKTVKELDDSREFIRMTVERQGTGGVLSAIFGDKAQALKELPNNGLNEDQTTKIIQSSIEDN
jgi:hypothetical protein